MTAVQVMMAVWLGVGVMVAPAPAAPNPGVVAMPAGFVVPLFGLDPGQERFAVPAFSLDVLPVTNAQFHAFVKANPTWGKGHPARLFADEHYLSHWRSGAPDAAAEQAPVINVSWYAAQAYCKARGGRLPTVLEWEYAAAASETKADASRDPEFVERILAWYARRGDGRSPMVVGQKPANVYGVKDLHGLVWEWTLDFNSVFVTGDNRQDGDKVKDLFCGDGATGAARREDYAAFMRYAMRSSLKADNGTANLGFRCAYDTPGRVAP